ncbi:probable G-protein coupled receptor Mth-like 5 [Nilaparvata lugens]|uniref:probable G-protein coupled receptor Mth-like 5 n=1 Tax=Nilaparvata lugens TaxID=108931 RepID=UPI00193E4CFE|nr:probable G-protein coupled receptor Mth-like 5 [Nilaparvata lugens]
MALIAQVLLLFLTVVAGGNIPAVPSVRPVRVQKCCPQTDLMMEGRCKNATEFQTSSWKPLFHSFQGKPNFHVPNFVVRVGIPHCGPRQHFSIYHYESSHDRLALLPDGRLRHYYLQDYRSPDSGWEGDDFQLDHNNFYDYDHGLFCMDKALYKTDENTMKQANYAIVCNPEVPTPWQSTDFLLRRIIDPACHGVALSCYLAVAIIHFVLQQLRDLVGNIITTLALSLAVAQVADTVRIFTEFTSPTTFLIADCVLFVSILGAFFWLNSLGYYIWKTFRSRNVFLRITDGRKYCYYSFYVWSCTIGMAVFAIFAHFTLDTTNPTKAPSPIAQGALGWLGTAVFFTPIAFTILVNIFFYASTMQIISRMSTYGRIHHKLKYSFETFVKILVVMVFCWFFLLMSWLPYNGMYYAYILTNAIQGPAILYISVLSQKRVRYLLRKACCYETCIFPCCRPDENEGPEWGEEMMAMNQ